MPDSSTPGPPPEPPAGILANPGGLKAPITDLLLALRQELANKPLLWVGAGASVAAGYPTTTKILEELARGTGKTFDPNANFTKEVEEFIQVRSEGELAEVLQKLFSPSGDGLHPTAVHRAIALLARAGCFSIVVTTNYDDLLERAFGDAGVPYVLQSLERNLTVQGGGAVRLLKLHGSREDWIKVILSSRSYRTFSQEYPLLTAQLDLELRKESVLFVGCSLQDPRILDWLAALSEHAARSLKPWRALITEKDWKTVTELTWEGGAASRALARGDVRPLLLSSHDDLPVLWSQTAADLAPDLPHLKIEIDNRTSMRPHRSDRPPTGYEYDVFVSYKTGFPFGNWVHEHFLQFFEPYLLNALNRSNVKIFVDTQELKTGDAWPNKIQRALACSRCMVAIWIPAYFHSEWCRRESAAMLYRERKLGFRTNSNPHGLLLPIRLFDGDNFPQEVRHIQYLNLVKYHSVGDGFKKTEPYVEMQGKLGEWAYEVADAIRRAPTWQEEWISEAWLNPQDPSLLPPPIDNFPFPGLE